jgi:hypothetical protein
MELIGKRFQISIYIAHHVVAHAALIDMKIKALEATLCGLP